MSDLSCACHTPPSSGTIKERPVRFRPGRGGLVMVPVACCAAWIAGAEAGQLGCEVAKPAGLPLRPWGLNGDVLTFDIAQPEQAVSEGVEEPWGSWVRKGGRGEKTYPGDVRPLKRVLTDSRGASASTTTRVPALAGESTSSCLRQKAERSELLSSRMAPK